jgi:hypothetical protein
MPETDASGAGVAGSPQELAQALFFPRQEISLGLNHDDIRRLVDLAYKVSLNPEEGVYPRFVFFVPEQGQPIRDPTVTFGPPIPLNTQTVKKLGSAIPSRPHALVVKKGNDQLQAVGVIRMEASGLSAGSPEFVMSAIFPGLVISVDGPGELTAINFCQGGPGIIRVLLFRNGLVQEGHDVLFWRARLICLIAQKAVLSSKQFHGDPRSVGLILEWSLSNILAQALKLRHGGAVVILPPEVSTEVIGRIFRIGYPIVDPSFGDLAFELTTAPSVDLVGRQERLSDTVLTAARLTTLDGCVVLSHKLGLLGAGAIIRIVEDSELPQCVSAQTNIAVDRPGGIFELGRLGTRHRSAAWLCKTIPGTLVYVISQDGTIRAFYSLRANEERGAVGCVRVCGPLAPVVGMSGHP